MKHSNLTSLLTSNFPHQPTSDQLNVINVLTRFLLTEATHPTLIIRGYAGTGKTSLVNTIVKSLSEIKKHFVLLAPTGRAAKVMMNYTQSLATTIHKKIYYSDNQNGEFGGFSLQRNMHKHTTFIVDEASMIGGDNFDFNYGASNLLDDLLSFIFSGENCQLIIIGDSAQLPPVGTAISPALNKSYLNAHFGLNIGQVELTEVVRQNKDSGILFNATNIRMQLHANNNSFPQINLNFPDIFAITGMELEEELDQAFSKFGDEDVIVLCRSNKRANLFNQQIRARIKWYEEELCAGDRLMSVKNNYFWLDQTSKAEIGRAHI